MTERPPISPDGQFYWDGTQWLPMPSADPSTRGPSSAQGLGSLTATAPRRLGWVGAAMAVVGLLLAINLMGRPMFLIGAADVGLPLVLGGGGIALAQTRGTRAAKVVAWLAGSFAVLIGVLAVFSVAST